MKTPLFSQSSSGAAICLQGVTDVAERGSVGQDGMPVGAGVWGERSADLGTSEGSAGERHDAAVTLPDVAEHEWLSEGGFEAVYRGQTRLGELKQPGPGALRVVRIGLERRDGDLHPAVPFKPMARVH